MKATTTNYMVVNTAALMQQMWRGAKIMDEFRRYAKQIGCTLGEGACWDEIECHTAQQERQLARWWTEHA